MLCSRVQNLLSAYCDSQLTGAEMLEIREHLTGCPGCSRELASLRQVRQLLRGLQPIEADRPFNPQVLEREPRLRFDLPDWYYEGLERLRLASLGFRRSACHLAAGASLGLMVVAVSALQAPPSPHAARALVPVEIPAEPSPEALQNEPPLAVRPAGELIRPFGPRFAPAPGEYAYPPAVSLVSGYGPARRRWRPGPGLSVLSLELNAYTVR